MAVADWLDPNMISFEITETCAATNMHAATEFASRLERFGCSLALDDFGTGFGSFTYLRHLPVQEIKIDIDFIRDLPHSLSDCHLIRVLASLAESLGKRSSRRVSKTRAQSKSFAAWAPITPRAI
jgi:EAL domain-containing protein (putative c-di-GMP-specific phosphodiesterase class I)